MHPDFGVGLKWKAIVAAGLHREAMAEEAIIRLRETEPGLTLDQHVAQIVTYPALHDRVAGAIATFERLWTAAGAIV